MSYIFGGDTGVSYGQLQQKRRLAEQLRGQNASMPRNTGEGIHAIARALVARGSENLANQEEARLQKSADEQWGQLFGGSSSSELPANAPEIREGLVSRGLPEHVADAFIMNFKDESGLNPGINEVEPLVPGSRGGFGLAQWTGPRRVALEDFAAQRGTAPSDVNTQLDFLMTELQGSEAKAAQAIMSTQDKGSAAQAIVNQFLRPAEEHRSRRAAQYGQASPNIAQIGAALSNPMIQRDPGKSAILQAMLQRELTPPQPTALQRDVEWLASQGVPLDEALKRLGRGTSVNVNTGDMLKPLGTEGNVLVKDPEAPGGVRVIQAEGSPAAQKTAEAAAQKERAGETALTNESSRSDVVSLTTSKIRKLLERDGLFDLPETGVIGSKLTGVNQEAADMAGLLDTLKGMVVFDRLEKLKQASANGASGLGQVTEREIALLGAQLGALDQSLSKEQILETLNTVDQTFSKLSPQARSFLLSRSDDLPGTQAPQTPQRLRYNPETGEFE